MIETLKTLCALPGVSGQEDAVREYLLARAMQVADKIETDAMGNLMVFRAGKCHDRTLMLCAHMDEVGVIPFTCPDACSVSTSSSTNACCPIRLSTFVFCLFWLKYFTAIGLVSTSSRTDTMINTTTCTGIPKPNTDIRSAASAPPANQIVVSPMVRSSITMSTINIINHPIVSIRIPPSIMVP